MATISIIIPVFKAEKFLGRCVDSILCQTYRDFELILVDDGSPDHCGAICDDYAAKDARVRVIHQKNGGAARARNAGIEWVLANSGSEWIHFVDSDDWVHPNILEFLLNAAETKGTDVSVCHYIETDGNMEQCPQPHPEITLCSPEQLFIEENVLSVVPWAKLYRKKCFENIRYPENRYAEDEFTTYRILFASAAVAVVQNQLYYYFCNADGLSKIKWSPKRMDGLDALQEQLLYFKENGHKDAFEMIACAYADHLLRQQRQIEETDMPLREKKRYQKMLRKRLYKALREHGGLYVREHRGIYVELYPNLTAAYRSVKQLVKRIIK